MRCLALAEGLVASGHVAALAAASLPAGIRAMVEGRDIPVLDLATPSDRESLPMAIEAWRADWVVLDGYEFDAADLRDAGERCRVLHIADDAEQDAYPCDILLNQNVYATADAYAGRSNARLLIGPRFALLRPEFNRFADWERETPARVRRILVTLGGSDPGGLTAEVVRQVRAELGDVSLTVVVGGGNPRSQALRAELEGEGSTRVVHAPPDMAQLMAAADLGVSAAGSTTAELAFMQLPSVLLVVAANQRPVAAALDAAGAARLAGEVIGAGPMVPGELRRIVRDLAADADARREIASAGRALVDGRGARRVVHAMAAAGLRLRAATSGDAELLLGWSNEPATRAASFNRDPIAQVDHVRWLDERLRDPDSLLFIGERATPAGQVRFQRDGDEAAISVSVAPECRGRGVAASLVDAGVRAAFDRWAVSRIRAEIRRDNVASMAVFADAGFNAPEPHPARPEALVMSRARPRRSDREENR